jgi:hypothetical protein
MFIEEKKLGNIEYAQSILVELKKQYIGMKIKDVKYDYYAESFILILENNDIINFTTIFNND